MRRRLRFSCGLILICELVLLSGCSGGSDNPQTVNVKGVVLYNGQPVEGADVIFTPTAGRPASGRTNAQGEFTLKTFEEGDGALPGEHVVTVGKVESAARTGGDPGRDPPSTAPVAKALLPAKYNDSRQSDLKASVTVAGPNDFKFELKD